MQLLPRAESTRDRVPSKHRPPHCRRAAEYPRQEAEHLAEFPEENPNTWLRVGRQVGHFADALWYRLAELWPTLSDTTRLHLVALAEAESPASR